MNMKVGVFLSLFVLGVAFGFPVSSISAGSIPLPPPVNINYYQLSSQELLQLYYQKLNEENDPSQKVNTGTAVDSTQQFVDPGSTVEGSIPQFRNIREGSIPQF